MNETKHWTQSFEKEEQLKTTTNLKNIEMNNALQANILKNTSSFVQLQSLDEWRSHKGIVNV